MTTCEGCAGSALPGVIYTPAPRLSYIVERCDVCAVFDSDEQAALRLAAKVNGPVSGTRVWSNVPLPYPVGVFQ